MSFQLLRKRISSEPVIAADYSAPHGTVGVQPAAIAPQMNTISGALARISFGLFGTSDPNANSSAEVVVPGRSALYHYHEGDLFTPGTGNYVFEYPFEFPVQTIWGMGFLRKPNTFNPQQPPQMQAVPNVTINGIGGLIAGQFAMQPLESDGQ